VCGAKAPPTGKEYVMKNESNDNNLVDAEEFGAAEKEAKESGDSYTLRFKKPFDFQGKTYKEITFDWSGLTGKDFISIENEMEHNGKFILTATYSGEFIRLMAARAAAGEISSDAFEYMSLTDYHKIRSAARAFLLRSELEPVKKEDG
jgi:hypothetical protein